MITGKLTVKQVEIDSSTCSIDSVDGYLTFTDIAYPSGINLSTIVAGASAGFSNMIYVDKAGNDSTGLRGDIRNPFLTINAALAAAQSGDIVQIGPGTWTEAVVLPELSSISLIGSGMDRTYIDGTAAGEYKGGITAQPTTTTLDYCTIADLTTYSGSFNGYGLLIDGTNLSTKGVCLARALILRNIRAHADTTYGARIRCVGIARVETCFLESLLSHEVGLLDIVATTVDSATEVQFYGGEDLPSGFSTCYASITGSYLNHFRPSYAVHVNVSGCTCTGITAIATAEFYIDASGCQCGIVTINVAGESNANIAKLDGASMSSLAITRTAGTGIFSVSALGASCIAEPVISSGISLNMIWTTPDLGFAVPMIWDGYTSQTGEVVQLADTWVISGETHPGQINSLTLSGATMTNTNAGRIYLNGRVVGTDYIVEAYSDFDQTILAATGTDTGRVGGDVALSESNGSGLTGTINLDALCVDDYTPIATLGPSLAVRTCMAAPAGESGRPYAGIVYTNGAEAGDIVWVVIAGRARILTFAGASCGGYLFVTAAAPPDNGKVVCEIARYAYSSGGIARALERVESGLVLAQLDMRGYGPELML